MKIVFLCGTLEPGRDGAGDQARCLAGELIRMGHEVSAVGIYDKHISKAVSENQDADGVALSVLRLPSTWSPKKRYDRAASGIAEFDPDWVSLQFVNFGFQKYGLPWDMLLYLKKIVGNARFHIMFQELWCGMGVNSGFKEKVLGKTQKAFTRMLLNTAKPKVVYTNNTHYASLLEDIGIQSELAPVFGNIPVGDVGSPDEWEELLNRADLQPLIQTRDSYFIMGFFGTVKYTPDVDKLVRDSNTMAHQQGKKLGILVIGHSRAGDIGEYIKENYNVSCWKTGKISAPMINRSMCLVDIAVSSTPANIIKKSSTAGAWLERGIPVVVMASDKTYCSSKMSSDGIFQAKSAEELLTAAKAKKQFKISNGLSEVARTYASLEQKV
ncbi:hypothetical protein RM545_06145 [Zunongwangia sp. F260]|uniref:Glycosyltransferase n=1 Tax=Autumnicola lenta TaxID=3075593 RepID=A0ABU3CIS7_9FLAO|nr:hypothetical protein [Zunongwangia sp. F260]MDT0646264.1 hypothetical protein [Zunongwangia sp. F260]